jgi:hypothetical protein
MRAVFLGILLVVPLSCRGGGDGVGPDASEDSGDVRDACVAECTHADGGTDGGDSGTSEPGFASGGCSELMRVEISSVRRHRYDWSDRGLHLTGPACRNSLDSVANPAEPRDAR